MIQPGLERIGRLLQNVQFPWKAVHVAGTNGKGSICGYTSNLLTRRLIKNGRFTSPHIVNRWDCININNEPVSEQEFRKIENHFIKLNERENINASEFELLTATAFALFNENKVDVGIIEVGMGGKLDATNILNNQVVSVISKIAHDHQGFLGDTLEEIALHKAGILRPNVPYIVNPMNDLAVHEVIENYAKEIGAGPRILPDTEELRNTVFKSVYFEKFAGELLPFQRDNAVLGFLAYLEVLRSMGLSTEWHRAVKMLSKTKNTQTLPGRQQTIFAPIVFGSRRPVLIDGAHNEDAANSLNDYVKLKLRRRPASAKHDESNPDGKYPITWVIAMTEGKEPRKVLKKLLKPGDNVITTSFGPVDGMPWVKSMHPEALLSAAKEACPGVTGLAVPKRGAYRALCAAKYLSRSAHIVLTGSLYLIGDFFREHEAGRKAYNNNEEFPAIKEIDQDEKYRVETFLGKAAQQSGDEDDGPNIRESVRTLTRSSIECESEEARRLRIEIEQQEKEMESFGQGKSGRSQSEPPTPSAKNKFFEDFENIRTQLEELSPGRRTPQVRVHAKGKSFRFSSTVDTPPERQRYKSTGDAPIMKPTALKIRFHDALSEDDVRPLHSRDVQSQGIHKPHPKPVYIRKNFAKTYRDTKENEPQYWDSIKSGSWDKPKP